FVDLIHLLQPCTFRIGGRDLSTRPTIAPSMLDDVIGLVTPVLAPMLGDDRFAERSVLLQDSHLEDVHETDLLSGVEIDVDLLRAPALIRRRSRIFISERRDLQEVERDAIRARHRENGAAIALEPRQSRRLQRLPFGGGRLRELYRTAFRRAAARLRRRAVE